MKQRKQSDEKTTTADSEKMPKMDKASAEKKRKVRLQCTCMRACETPHARMHANNT